MSLCCFRKPQYGYFADCQLSSTAKNVEYPIVCRENGIEGKVYIRFVVTEIGDVDQVEVTRGVHPLLDQAAVDVIKKLPKWRPGEQFGKKVKVWHTVPIHFKLEN